MCLHNRFQVRGWVLQQVEQFCFKFRIDFAATSWLRGVGKAVYAMRLPLIKPTAHSLGMHFVYCGQLFQRRAFGRQKNGLRSLAQTVDRPLTVDLFEGRTLRVRERGNKLGTGFHAGILPDGKIPGFFCTITYNLFQK